MRAAVISLTENGRLISRKIAGYADDLIVSRYCFFKHTDTQAEDFSELSVLTEKLFSSCDALIFVCACGIAVRMLAPHIRSKQTDPAVIVIDDCGSFVIPILSGHIGGANALAKKLAEILGAQAVITTATDSGGRFSPDSFAAANDLLITDFKAAKEIAAAVLNGEMIGLISDYEYRGLPPELRAGENCRTGIVIGTAQKKPFSVTLELVPKNVVLGIGCRRGTKYETIEQAVFSALEKAAVPIERVCAVSTIDIKADEQGLLEFCRRHGLPLFAYSAEQLLQVQGEFTSSEFVRDITGVDNVCERSAVKCSGGSLILCKTAGNGVTVAAAEKPVIIDFERKML